MFFFFPQETEECFEVSTDVKGYESSCKNITLRLPPMQQALCICVSKTDPVAAVPSPYPATTPPPPPRLTASLCEVQFCCQYQRTANVHLDTQHTPVTAVMSKEHCVPHYFKSSASLFKKVLEATGTPRR